MKYKLLLLFMLLNLAVFGQTATLPDGAGTLANPYKIATVENLFWLTQNSDAWDKNFIQTAELNVINSASWDGGKGFSPIGGGIDNTSFQGTYDGQGYTIENVYMNRATFSFTGVITNFAGVFGVVRGATITNLAVNNSTIIGDEDVGPLVGHARDGSTISNCYSENCVITGLQMVGGLIGSSTSTSTDIRCNYTNNNTVTGENSVGGLVGENSSSAQISNCYSNSEVNGSGVFSFDIGGLVGKNTATVNKCYSTGKVTGDNYFGGLIGNNTGGTVLISFWDTQTSMQPASAGGTAKTTAEMKTMSTFTSAGWNFTTEWQMFGTNYPDLQCNTNPALPVELTTFNINVVDKSAILNWETATEVNNYGFEIEKQYQESSLPSVLLEGIKNQEWEKVAFVEGHGNSNSPKYYSHTDNSLETSGKYLYRLKQIDIDGTFEYSDEVEINLGSPNNFELTQNYPNPFNPTTSISYSIPNDARVTLAIYDVLGNSVTILENGNKSAGTYSYSFDASNLTSGIYFYNIRANDFIQTKKMLLIK